MKNILAVIPLFVFMMFISCDNKADKSNEKIETNLKDSVVSDSEVSMIATKPNSMDHYFTATGTEPFWGLEISENQIKLKTIVDSILTPHANPIRVMDSNIKLYKIQTESSIMNIEISQSECTNAMSGKVSPYSVTLEYKKNTDKNVTTLEGCGKYIIDYRLHDIWVLETLNGETITKSDFKNEIPTMEINSNSNAFTGYAGCNRMNGKMFSERELLRFTDIITTKMMCGPNNKEPEFLKALQASISYKIENNRLKLSNPNDEMLTFKKVD